MQNVLGQRALGALSIPATSMDPSHFFKFQTSKKNQKETQIMQTSFRQQMKSAILKTEVARK